MNELKDFKYIDNIFYKCIKDVLEQSRKRIYRNIQTEMVLAYWQIGKMIFEKQGGKERAKYGDGLIRELSMQLTRDFGRGYTISNLKSMRQFYVTFQKSHALRGQLSWTYYRLVKV